MDFETYKDECLNYLEDAGFSGRVGDETLWELYNKGVKPWEVIGKLELDSGFIYP